MELLHDIIDDPDEYWPFLLFVAVLLIFWVILTVIGIISVRSSKRRRKFWFALPPLLFGLIGVKSQIPISWTSGTFQAHIDFGWFFLLPLALGIAGLVQWFKARRAMRLGQSIWLALLLLNLTGCGSTNVSNQEPFSSYIGHPMELRYPVALVEKRSEWTENDARGVHSLKRADFGLKGLPPYNEGSMLDNANDSGKFFARLPSGHRVQIDRVLFEAFIDGGHIVAYGRTTMPNHTNEVTFAYVWGLNLILQRAPWDSPSIPARRDVSLISD